MVLALQRSFDDLGTALVDTEFVVFDLETTGGSPIDSMITEVGAVKVRGGEVLGEFQTLVDPGVPIPPGITALTGITNAMVSSAPSIDSVLPAFLEFCGDAVLVAHNSAFDTGFIRANAIRLGYTPQANPVVCTVRLSRRLVRDEVPNLKLETLAYALRARTAPSHRALDDARATTDVFHALLEQCGRWGVTHIDDLLWFQSSRGHPSYQKVKLASALPRARGVYLFRSAQGRVLYVGKATDLRTRVRSYFGDERRHIDDMLREMSRVDHVLCATDLDCSVLEARLIRKHSPPFNRAQRGKGKPVWLRLSDERFPRLASARAPSPGALGPVSSKTATVLREALEEATDIRTCTMRITARTNVPACVRGQIGRCPAPCERPVDPVDYGALIASAEAALQRDPSRVLESLGARIDRLSGLDRFEEAAATRDRLSAVVDSIRTARSIEALTRAGRLTIGVGANRITIADGLVESIDGAALACAPDGHPDEPRLVAAWLARNRSKIRIEQCSGEFAQPIAGGAQIAAWTARLRRLQSADAKKG
jgi:DNA polymerase III subunit epsilon